MDYFISAEIKVTFCENRFPCGFGILNLNSPLSGFWNSEVVLYFRAHESLVKFGISVSSDWVYTPGYVVTSVDFSFSITTWKYIIQTHPGPWFLCYSIDTVGDWAEAATWQRHTDGFSRRALMVLSLENRTAISSLCADTGALKCADKVRTEYLCITTECKWYR